MQTGKSIAVVGAGLSGSILARRLMDAGLGVTVFDKSHHGGGRMTVKPCGGELVDIGVPCFPSSNTEGLQSQKKQWLEQGILVPWHAPRYDFHADAEPYLLEDKPLYIGKKSQAALSDMLLNDIEYLFDTRISQIHAEDGWYLNSFQGDTYGPYDFIVLALPAPRVSLLLKSFPLIQEEAKQVNYVPCWVSVVSFAEALNPGFEYARAQDRFNGFPGQNPLYMLAHHNSKPGRQAVDDIWTLYWCARESIAFKDISSDEASERSLQALSKLLGRELPEAQVSNQHWLYAQAFESLNTQDCIFDADIHLGLCGDWFEPGGVDAAMQSAEKLATKIIKQLS